MWKIMISPEEYFQMDPEVFAWSVMDRLQQVAGFHGQGQYADWLGVVHTNTSNPHIHLLVRGIDVSGKDFLLRRSTIKDLRTMASDIQDTLSEGFTSSPLIREERQRASFFLKLPNVENTNLDSLIANADQGIPYDRLLEKVARHRRKALHGRLIYLEKTGLITIGDEGQVLKVDGFNVKFRGTRNLFRYLNEQRAIRYSDPRTLSLASDKSAPIHGLVSGIVFEPELGETFGVLESLNDHAVAFRILPHDLGKVTQVQESRSMVTLSKGSVTLADGDTLERLNKMRARGRVVAELRSAYSAGSRDDFGQ